MFSDKFKIIKFKISYLIENLFINISKSLKFEENIYYNFNNKINKFECQ